MSPVRRQIEAAIEALVGLLDAIDPDPDLEPDADTEPNGDELDASFPEGSRGAITIGNSLLEDCEEDDPPEDADPAEDNGDREPEEGA